MSIEEKLKQYILSKYKKYQRIFKRITNAIFHIGQYF